MALATLSYWALQMCAKLHTPPTTDADSGQMAHLIETMRAIGEAGQTHDGDLYAEVTASEVVVLGSPPPEPDDGDSAHHCDAMGCGRDHVVGRYRIRF